MTKQERKLIWKVYSLLQIVKDEIPEYYLRDEIEKLSAEMLKSLED